jgi:hypothetical protein
LATAGAENQGVGTEAEPVAAEQAGPVEFELSRVGLVEVPGQRIAYRSTKSGCWIGQDKFQISEKAGL